MPYPQKLGKARSFEPRFPANLFYQPKFLKPGEQQQLVDWLVSLIPLWELRFSTHRPLPAGETQRKLLRPVYWLGNWQFACLDYYRPPKGLLHRCVKAEPFPAPLQHVVNRIEKIARRFFAPRDVPAKWRLNTCLVNYYGKRLEGEKWTDVARVGEHRDFEPGPVASLSFGERAMFQFVSSRRKGSRDAVVFQQWLEDGSLQLFGGDRWKNQLFHRVQRVERKTGYHFPVAVDGFLTRRINLTFRYVPVEHIGRYADLPAQAATDIEEYMETLARHSAFFQRERQARVTPDSGKRID